MNELVQTVLSALRHGSVPPDVLKSLSDLESLAKTNPTRVVSDLRAKCKAGVITREELKVLVKLMRVVAWAQKSGPKFVEGLVISSRYLIKKRRGKIVGFKIPLLDQKFLEWKALTGKTDPIEFLKETIRNKDDLYNYVVKFFGDDVESAAKLEFKSLPNSWKLSGLIHATRKLNSNAATELKKVLTDDTKLTDIVTAAIRKIHLLDSKGELTEAGYENLGNLAKVGGDVDPIKVSKIVTKIKKLASVYAEGGDLTKLTPKQVEKLTGGGSYDPAFFIEEIVGGYATLVEQAQRIAKAQLSLGITPAINADKLIDDLFEVDGFEGFFETALRQKVHDHAYIFEQFQALALLQRGFHPSAIIPQIRLHIVKKVLQYWKYAQQGPDLLVAVRKNGRKFFQVVQMKSFQDINRLLGEGGAGEILRQCTLDSNRFMRFAYALMPSGEWFDPASLGVSNLFSYRINWERVQRSVYLSDVTKILEALPSTAKSRVQALLQAKPPIDIFSISDPALLAEVMKAFKTVYFKAKIDELNAKLAVRGKEWAEEFIKEATEDKSKVMAIRQKILAEFSNSDGFIGRTGQNIGTQSAICINAALRVLAGKTDPLDPQDLEKVEYMLREAFRRSFHNPALKAPPAFEEAAAQIANVRSISDDALNRAAQALVDSYDEYKVINKDVPDIVADIEFVNPLLVAETLTP